MTAIAIQAGGKSRRMGRRDKALLELGGKPLIEHVLSRVSGLGKEILITTNNPADLEYLGVRLVSDRNPGAGALNGLETALAAARCDYVLVLACDMPFVSRPLLEHILQLASRADVILPRPRGLNEPLQALYHRGNCLPAVRKAVADGEKRVISFFPQVKVHTVDDEILARLDPAGLSFYNVNDPMDLAEAEEMLANFNK
jgi:molybdopterin-guanine dinucleotide biosynthesis protein A